jgi:hypothetical protein
MMSIGTQRWSLGCVYSIIGKLNGRIVKSRAIGRVSGGATTSNTGLTTLSDDILNLRNWKFQSSVFDNVAPDVCLHAFTPSPPCAAKECLGN